MVSPGRYLAHHKAKADEIESLLHQFGASNSVSGFYCKHEERWGHCLHRWCTHVCPTHALRDRKETGSWEERERGCPKFDWGLMWLYHGSWDAETTFHPELHEVPEECRPHYPPMSREIAELRRRGQDAWRHVEDAEVTAHTQRQA